MQKTEESTPHTLWQFSNIRKKNSFFLKISEIPYTAMIEDGNFIKYPRKIEPASGELENIGNSPNNFRENYQK